MPKQALLELRNYELETFRNGSARQQQPSQPQPREALALLFGNKPTKPEEARQ